MLSTRHSRAVGVVSAGLPAARNSTRQSAVSARGLDRTWQHRAEGESEAHVCATRRRGYSLAATS